MDTGALQSQFEHLPAEAKREVIDFVAFLHKRYGTALPARRRRRPLHTHPFVGLWKNRKDMADGAEWVRKLRTEEWR